MSTQSLSRSDLGNFALRHRADFERWLADLVNIPSVSVDPAHANDVQHCAELAVELLHSVGASAVSLLKLAN